MDLFSAERFNRSKWRRFIIVTAVMVLVFLAVIARLAQLQLLQGEALAMKAERQYRHATSVEGERGLIFDRSMRELAINLDMPSIYGVPYAIEDPGKVAKKISGEVNMNSRYIARRLKSEKQFVWIGRRMSPEVIKKIDAMNLKGIGFIPETRRFYPKKELISHILGFTDIDNHGLEGIERYYEEKLRGENGSILFERDARRRPVMTNTLLAPLKGNDLILTIDEVIQYIMEKELASAVDEHNASNGIGIVMDPYSGEILAMAVYPKFNPNAPGEYISEHRRNKAITDIYEPGSTFKLIVASGAIEEGLISPHEIVHDGSGRMAIGRSAIHDPHPSGQSMTFKEIIAHSSNIGAAKIGMKLGKEHLYKYIKAFGFGEKTGIDLPGEAQGIVRDPSLWSGRSLVTLSIGQEIGVTPIQLITAVSAIGNGGWLVKPHIVSGIRDSHGDVKRIRSEIRWRVISGSTSRKMVDVLKEVVSPDGTGKLAMVSGFSAAGKTGTAQKIDHETGRYSRSRFMSSFVGFVPAESPEVAILVIVDEPEGNAWGGSVAAPVFKRVAEQTLQYLRIEPEERERITVMAQN